jgi:hypothetical protein|tara:strand:+ start:4787 stop:5407 length:621 start_codon:yes stop_codon:yes gene_type:complete
MNSLNVRPITRQAALPIIVDRHYMGRVPPISRAFGLFNGEKMIGIVTYGVSGSTTLRRGVCGDEQASNVYELTRLWTEDDAPKNAASFLISQSLKMIDKEIIVTFAEINAGHVGTIYQASNFFYCGLSAKFKDPKVKGLEHQHHTTYAHGMNMQQVRDKYGAENVYYVDRPRKHRYVYINAKKKRRRDLIKLIKYEVLPYPKHGEI